jgi:hypothetical protein
MATRNPEEWTCLRSRADGGCADDYVEAGSHVGMVTVRVVGEGAHVVACPICGGWYGGPGCYGQCEQGAAVEGEAG